MKFLLKRTYIDIEVDFLHMVFMRVLSPFPPPFFFLLVQCKNKFPGHFLMGEDEMPLAIQICVNGLEMNRVRIQIRNYNNLWAPCCGTNKNHDSSIKRNLFSPMQAVFTISRYLQETFQINIAFLSL